MTSNEMCLGLLPEPERRPTSFLASAVINGTILAVILYIGATAKHMLDQQQYESTEMMMPIVPPRTHVKISLPPPPKVRMEEKKVAASTPAAMAVRSALPVVKLAAMPTRSLQVRPSVAPVHLGQTFGVIPNPNAMRVATVAAIGNPYGGMQGPAVAPHGVVGSTGMGNGSRVGSSAGLVRVAGRVGSTGLPGMGVVQGATGLNEGTGAASNVTDLEILSKPPALYTSEARQLKIQGNVVLRVAFLASGQVEVQRVIRGLGHGLDEEACRVAQQIRFRPAMRGGRPVDVSTTITISFLMA